MNQDSAESFRRACGVAGPLRLTVSMGGGTAQRTDTLPFPVAIIGRNQTNDLVLDDARVSRRHAYVQVIAGRPYCIDLGSRTGVVWGGIPRQAGWLDDDQDLEIGGFRVHVEGTADGRPPGWDPLRMRPADEALLTPAVFEVCDKRVVRPTWRVSRVLSLIGHAQPCKVRLRFPRVAAYHAALVGTPEGVWVIDLLSQEGTYVNGQRVRWAPLHHADRLEIGGVLVRPWYDTPIVSSPPPTAQALPVPLPRAEVASPLPPRFVDQFGQLLQAIDSFQHNVMMLAQLIASVHKDQMQMVREEMGRLERLTQEIIRLQTDDTRRRPVAVVETEPVPTHLEVNPMSRPAAEPTPVYAVVEPPGASTLSGAEGPQSAAKGNDWVAERIAALERERQSLWQKLLGAVLGK